jgi:hypothetical protein
LLLLSALSDHCLDDLTFSVEDETAAHLEIYIHQRFEANLVDQRKSQLLVTEIMQRATEFFSGLRFFSGKLSVNAGEEFAHGLFQVRSGDCRS